MLVMVVSCRIDSGLIWGHRSVAGPEQPQQLPSLHFNDCHCSMVCIHALAAPQGQATVCAVGVVLLRDASGLVQAC